MRTAVLTRRPALLFLAPCALGVLLLVLLPAALTLRLALTDATGLSPTSSFTGLANVRRALADPLLAASLSASLLHVAVAVPLRLLAAAGLGLLLAAPRPGGRLFRAAVYVPSVVPDIALALLVLWLLNPLHGPVNAVLGLLGLPQPVWLSTPGGARAAVLLLVLLPIGEAFLVVLAARRSLPPSVHEAAALEGAGPWQQLRRVTLPLLAPLLVLLAARDTVVSLQAAFVPAYLLTDGGPGSATLYLPLYVYDQAFEFAGLGYAALLTLLLLACTAAVVGVQLLLARRWRLLG